MDFGGNPETMPFIQGAYVNREPILKKTIEEISLTNRGVKNSIDIAVVGDIPDSLRWFLKDYLNVSYFDSLLHSQSPSIVLTKLEEEPKLASEYRGQEIVWQKVPLWADCKLMEYAKWIADQSVPTSAQSITLWARTDLFPTVTIANMSNGD